MERIFKILDDLKIDYENFSHNPTFSCNDICDIDLPWKRVKSLILTNKNKTNFYMIVLSEEKKLDVKILQKFFVENKLSFASEENILKKIWIKIGHISPFALINNQEKDIKIIFDKNLKWEKVWFHPLRNDKTVVLNLDDMEKFLKKIWFSYDFLDL